jgi:hypothetical protein
MPVTLRREEQMFYVASNQFMPAAPMNFREQALADLEDN